MLKEFHLCVNHGRRVKRFETIGFKPGLNLLIGPNGSGKSTLLKAIAQCPEGRRVTEGETEYAWVDTIAMNPCHAEGPVGDYTNMVLRSRARTSSHGEILQDLFRTVKFTPATCLLLDEPEAGQDFDHVLRLRGAIDRAVARGVQVICSTHQILFWERAHTIELEQGYRARVLREFCRLRCSTVSS